MCFYPLNYPAISDCGITYVIPQSTLDHYCEVIAAINIYLVAKIESIIVTVTAAITSGLILLSKNASPL